MKHRNSTRHLVQAALIAAVYVVLTYLVNAMGWASGAVQLRLSEALTVLPFFVSSAVPGLWIGCMLANLLTGSALWDVVFGSLATLLGALGTCALRNRSPYLACVPPILANTLIIPFVLRLVYGDATPMGFLFLTVGLGEVLSCGLCGTALLFVLRRRGGLR